jgi:hypothetical protein
MDTFVYSVEKSRESIEENLGMINAALGFLPGNLGLKEFKIAKSLMVEAALECVAMKNDFDRIIHYIEMEQEHES